VIDTFLDKRPYFFSFLIALLHDLTGYRLENVFVLNAALTLATLAAVYWLSARSPAASRRHSSRSGCSRPFRSSVRTPRARAWSCSTWR
jgi:hypothetical protein